MRKVASGLFTTIDNAAESPEKFQLTWDAEMAATLARTLEKSDAVLLGRRTYEMWADYWPNYSGSADAAFKDWINESPKYVVSKTLDNVGKWQNSHLIRGDLAAEITKLKEGEGGDIAVAGSPGLVASLLEKDLLDELQLTINPVIAGSGLTKLFPGDATLKKLELVSAQTTSSGAIIATYRPAR
jgi:dihydrofolate reductase